MQTKAGYVLRESRILTIKTGLMRITSTPTRMPRIPPTCPSTHKNALTNGFGFCGSGGPKLTEMKAKNLMNSNPLTALDSDNLQVAEKRMREAKVQCLIVKNLMNEVVGVIQIFE